MEYIQWNINKENEAMWKIDKFCSTFLLLLLKITQKDKMSAPGFQKQKNDAALARAFGFFDDRSQQLKNRGNLTIKYETLLPFCLSKITLQKLPFDSKFLVYFNAIFVKVFL